MGGMERKAPIKADGAMHGSCRADKICNTADRLPPPPDSSARKKP